MDRGNLGRQTKTEFDQYVSPVNNFKFGEEYVVQHVFSNNLDNSARVVISTIQRMFRMHKGRALPADLQGVTLDAKAGACSFRQSCRAGITGYLLAYT